MEPEKHWHRAEKYPSSLQPDVGCQSLCSSTALLSPCTLAQSVGADPSAQSKRQAADKRKAKPGPAEAPTPTHSCPKKHQALDMLAAINFYLVKAQGVPVASIDPVCGTRITRLQLGCPGVPCCLACKSAQKPLAQAYKHLERPQIQLDSAPTPRPRTFISSFPILV